MINIKNIQIAVIIFLSTLVTEAKVYIGLQSNYMVQSNHVKFTGKDYVGGNTYVKGRLHNTNHRLTLNTHTFDIDFLCGYYFNNFLLEANYTYHQNQKKRTGIDLYDDGPQEVSTNSLDHENITIGLKQAVSLFFGADIPINKVLSEIIGVKINASEYKINASHTSKSTKRIRPDNNKTKRTFIFSIEPTLGIKYKVNPNVSIRVLAGYMIGNTKKVISNYIGEPNAVNNYGINCGVSLQPKSFNLKIGVIYTF